MGSVATGQKQPPHGAGKQLEARHAGAELFSGLAGTEGCFPLLPFDSHLPPIAPIALMHSLMETCWSTS